MHRLRQREVSTLARRRAPPAARGFAVSEQPSQEEEDMSPSGTLAAALSAAPGVDAYTMTPGRLAGTLAALLALAGVVAGGWAVARPGGSRKAVTALAAGVIGMIVGGIVVGAAEGGPGTGYGIVGGFAAMAIGLAAAALGWLALARSRRNA
jgi:hypothetical protein